ncbi:mechanosensitive ion channel domain-containing protein [Aureimonas jatrophae]|uniref:Small conductance mechanosensitive channel n=1 Tax=Aureimonas jatrophae TaxID=1166073 RepID=A0A1H0MUZ2_9HYPH|nr:mechanosensitive ion channel domain-containing protein [Aureimonas jatrophae]MBB3951205.1 small conductance mechanosensitive channel [Aureimonas jatrophae]SDO84194.1 small conductance mechanosensitive channel [Aureimonas jatrophae]
MIRRAAWAFVLVLLTVLPAAAQLPTLPGLSGTTGSAPAADRSAEDRQSLDDLIGILENEATRNRLIESLKASAYRPADGQSSGSTQAGAEAGDETIVDSVPAYLADTVRGSVEAVRETVVQFGEIAGQGANFLAGAQWIDLPRIWLALQPILIVIVVVIATRLALRFAARPIERWIVSRDDRRSPLRRLLLLALATIVDGATIVLAAACGHLAALWQQGGPPTFNQALFLNAFVLTEMIRLGLAAFVVPRHRPLRLTPFSDGQAAYWYRRLALLVSLLGYTFLFVAPIVQTNSSIAASNAVRFIAVTLVFVSMLTLIVVNTHHVGGRLQRAYRNGDHSFQARFYAFLGTIWYLPAISFIFALYAVWLSSPRSGFQFMLSASLRSVAAMAIGGLIVTILSRFIVQGFRIPEGTKARFPLLERRINSFIPRLLLVLRVLVILIVLGVILDAWSILDFANVLQSDLTGRAMRGTLGALLILFLGFVAYLVVSSWVEYRLNPNYGSVPTSRERTLLALFRNAFTVALAVIVMMLVLSQLGIDIAPLLAGAGVVGLAIGFGAQKLVQDIITGAFIQIENALNEGDVVQLGSVSGVVEKLTIRSVSLRSLDGTYHLIPFSSVDQVSNMTKDFSNFVADVAVAYREDVEEVKAAMQEAFDRVRSGEQGINIIADFEMLGVEMLGDNAVTVRGRIRTLPGKQWPVGRIYRQVIKTLLDERGIEIPFPQTTVWFGENKNHEAAPLRIAQPAPDPASEPAPRADERRRDASLHTLERNPDGTLIPPSSREDDVDDGPQR